MIKVDDELLNYKKFGDVVKNLPEHKLRVARLATAAASARPKTRRRRSSASARGAPRVEGGRAAAVGAGAARPRGVGSSRARGAAREGGRGHEDRRGLPRSGRRVRQVVLQRRGLVGAGDETGPAASARLPRPRASPSHHSPLPPQPIIKKVDPGSMAEVAGLVPGDVVLSVNGISGLSNFQVVEMLRKGHGVFNLVVISGRQVQQQLNAAQQPQG